MGEGLFLDRTGGVMEFCCVFLVFVGYVVFWLVLNLCYYEDFFEVLVGFFGGFVEVGVVGRAWLEGNGLLPEIGAIPGRRKNLTSRHYK